MTTSPVLASEIKLGGGSDDPAGTQPMTPVVPRVASQPFSLTKLTMTYHPETIGLENLFIGIAGLIGAGKTTLCTALGKALDLPCYYEPVIDNEYLSDFYEDRKRYSFPLQIYLLNQRFRQQQQIIWQGKGGVQDRTIYEDSVFARMLRDRGEMDERDFKTYMSLFANMSNFMRKPNLIIYLDVNPEESAERIQLRSRDMEKSIPIDYLADLRAAYEEFIRDISRVIPVIRVSWSRFRTAEEMAALVKTEYLKLCNIRTVSWEDDVATTAAAATATEE